ncbi:hypothetical protein M120_5172 [Bacteroides fragilis str. 3783N1-8]|nr:hypothetical protein M120_5172 [Bacteroides fragilis str. 3783N1-8]
MIFAKEKIFFKENHFLYLFDIQLLINLPRVRAFHIRKRVVFETIKKNFSKSFAVLKNGFIIVMYSKAKQTANKYGEKRIKK